MYEVRHTFALTVDGSGNGTFFSSDVATGPVNQISWVPDGVNPLDTNAVLTIVSEESAVPIITITHIGTVAVTFAPRQPTHSVTGAAALYAAGGVAVNDRIALAGERIKVTVSGGGVSKTGQLSIVVG